MRSRLNRASFSMRYWSCRSVGPPGPAVCEFWLSATEAPLSVVRIGLSDIEASLRSSISARSPSSDVGLELREEVVLRGAVVHLEGLRRTAAVRGHGFEDLAALECDRPSVFGGAKYTDTRLTLGALHPVPEELQSRRRPSALSEVFAERALALLARWKMDRIRVEARLAERRGSALERRVTALRRDYCRARRQDV